MRAVQDWTIPSQERGEREGNITGQGCEGSGQLFPLVGWERGVAVAGGKGYSAMCMYSHATAVSSSGQVGLPGSCCRQGVGQQADHLPGLFFAFLDLKSPNVR